MSADPGYILETMDRPLFTADEMYQPMLFVPLTSDIEPKPPPLNENVWTI
jgi:hypothetical protein